MSDMLRKHATRWYGCCAACARGRNHNHKPQRLARRQARKVERRDVKDVVRVEIDELKLRGVLT